MKDSKMIERIFNLTLLFLFIFINSKALSQPNLNLPTVVLKYHDRINEAELAIIDGSYTLAHKKYIKAFKLFTGFTSDYYNALLIAQKLKKNKMLQNYLTHFYHIGICREFLKQFNFDLKIVKTKSRSAINMHVARKVDSLFFEDQKVRMQKTNGKDLVKKIDSSNFVFFSNLVHLYGFPDENLIGVDCSPNKKGISLVKIRILLKHFALNREKGIKDLIVTALINGKLKPEVYAELISFIDENYYKYDPVGLIGSDKYILCDSIRTKEIINKKRKEIGLFPIDDQVAKINYRLNNPDSLYRLTETLGTSNLTQYSNKYIAFIRKNCEKI